MTHRKGAFPFIHNFLGVYHHRLKDLLNTRMVGLGVAQEFAFHTRSQVMPVLKNHYPILHDQSYCKPKIIHGTPSLGNVHGPTPVTYWIKFTILAQLLRPLKINPFPTTPFKLYSHWLVGPLPFPRVLWACSAVTLVMQCLLLPSLPVSYECFKKQAKHHLSPYQAETLLCHTHGSTPLAVFS